jgi:predicted Zn-dependent protease
LKFKEFYLLPQKSKKAKKHAAMVLTSFPHDPGGHLLRGRSFIAGKEFEEGLSELKKSLELGPNYEQICLDLARANLAMKKPEEAEASLE